eukprot:648207-Rhodomonas_salina.1
MGHRVNKPEIRRPEFTFYKLHDDSTTTSNHLASSGLVCSTTRSTSSSSRNCSGPTEDFGGHKMSARLWRMQCDVNAYCSDSLWQSELTAAHASARAQIVMRFRIWGPGSRFRRFNYALRFCLEALSKLVEFASPSESAFIRNMRQKIIVTDLCVGICHHYNAASVFKLLSSELLANLQPRHPPSRPHPSQQG